MRTRPFWMMLTLVLLITGWAALRTPLFRNPTEGIVGFFKAQAEKGWYTNALATPLEPFYIDLKASAVACPNIGRNTVERWRNVLENMLPESAGAERIYRVVVRIHLLETGYHLFIIDRSSRACTEEIHLDTFDFTEARRAAERHWVLWGSDIWKRIDPRDDWKYVYSVEQRP